MILLNNHRYALITGIVLAIILAVLIGGPHFNMLGFARWFHIVAGVFWIGLLYYFNVVQTPALADAAADKGGPGGAGVTKYVAPRALFWFRWTALATWLGGRLATWARNLGPRLHPGRRRGRPVGLLPQDRHRRLARHHHAAERVGRDLAEPEEDPRHHASNATRRRRAARKTAGLASRVNFVLSIPMLMCMAAASHGLPFIK